MFNECCAVCRLKSLGEGSKVWSSSAPNLGKSPKHAPMTAGFSSLNEMGESLRYVIICASLTLVTRNNLMFVLFSLLPEECGEFEESPGSLLPSEASSNGAMEDSGSLWSSVGSSTMCAVGNTNLGPGGLGTGVSYQDSLRRCSQRKKSDMSLLGCASLLAAVALGQDLLQFGKLQVGTGHELNSGTADLRFDF